MPFYLNLGYKNLMGTAYEILRYQLITNPHKSVREQSAVTRLLGRFFCVNNFAQRSTFFWIFYGATF